MENIAIIGMSCRFPGAASSIDGFWRMLKEGQSAWSEFPADRLNINGFYHPDGHRQGSIHFKGAHFLRNNLASFDAAFFSMTEEELKALDPQQRLLLETSYEAIESAGLRIEDLKGSDTSVYVGAFVRDYEQISLRDMDFQPRYAATGSGTAIMSNRISYFYDLRGPSMTVDTGCSGSMVALHQACQSIYAGNSTLAIAGGAGLVLTPNTMMPMTALNFLSPDGKSYTFDSRANGYGRGEGVGLVILKKLCDALKDNDPIRAVIRSSHLSQDGRTAGITLPNPEAQMFNIRRAYEQANLNFDQTGYVECHGTGTQAGDTAELKAIAQTLAHDRSPDSPLILGSVKPNIGHLEGAAGIAGVIKAALVVENASIPPNINFKEGNPSIKFKEWKLQVPTEPRSWPISGIRRASVNCFGFGGTNAHAILDEGEHYVKTHRRKLLESSSQPAEPVTYTSQRQLLLLSGPNKQSVERVTEALADHVAGLPLDLSQKDMDNIAYTLGCRRSNFKWKGFVTAAGKTELLQALSTFHPDDFVPSDPVPDFKIAFTFCGQGAQRPQMGRDLMHFPVFRKSLELASEYLKRELLCSYDLVEEMMKPATNSVINEPHISQPATTALQVALVDLLASFGIRPTAVVGHSSGEIAAAYACSIISRETAWAVSYHRGVCAKRLKERARPRGSMCFVALSEPAALALIAKYSGKVDVSVACINSSKSVTLSGNARDMATVVRDVRSRNIFCREVATGVAYHTKHMESIKQEYLDAMNHIPQAAQTLTCEMYSTLTGKRMREADCAPQYWADNLVSPVQFADAMTAMIEVTRPDMVLELGPHAVLKAPTLENINTSSFPGPVQYSAALSKTGDEESAFLSALGHLWTHGCEIDMSQIITRNGTTTGLDTLTSLPLYPWDHTKTFWHESTVTKEYRLREHGRKDLIGAPSADTSPQEPRWRGFLRISENPWLKDHQIQQTIIYPAAGMISTAIEGARQQIPDGIEVSGFEVLNMEIRKPMVIPESDFGLETMVNMKRTSPDSSKTGVSFEWSIYARVQDGPWTHHANGTVHAVATPGHAASATEVDKAASRAISRPSSSINVKQYYDSLDRIGMNYGPYFRNITNLVKGDGASIGTITVADTKASMPAGYEFNHIVHPTALDSAFQLLFALDDRPMVPTSIDSVYVSAKASLTAGDHLLGCAKAKKQGLRGAEATIALTNTSWSDASIVVKGLHLTALSPPNYIPSHRNLCSEMQWKEDYTTSLTGSFEKLLELMTHKYGQISILQVGGSHFVGKRILELLESPRGSAARVARYSFSSMGGVSFRYAMEDFGQIQLRHVAERRTLRAPSDTPKYHLIIHLSYFSKTAAIEKYLHPDGILIKREDEKRTADYESDSACSVDEAAHRVTLRYLHGKQEVAIPMSTTPVFEKLRQDCRQQSVMILLPDEVSADLLQLKDNLLAQLSAMYVGVYDCRLQDVANGNVSLINCIVISLLDLASIPFFWKCREEDFYFFKAMRDVAKSILWVTQGAVGATRRPQSAVVTGLVRTLASEDPEISLVTMSLGCETSLSASTTSRVILKALKRSMLLEVERQPRELEYMESGNRLLIPRLQVSRPLNENLEEDPCRLPQTKQLFLGGERKTWMVKTTGDNSKPFEKAFFVPQKFSTPLGPNEVEINMTGAALHQSDLNTFMGLSRSENIGVDVQGIVTSLGSGVKGLRIGDWVVGMASGGAFSNRLRLERRFVKRIVGSLLTCIPSIWVTIYYSLAMRCRITPRTRVLVHRGATAIGQIAIQIARITGAKVYTTICNNGTDEKCQKSILMDGFGFANEEIEDCSQPGWDARLLQKTGGHLMDIVLVPGEIPFNCSVVKKTGTVVHIDGSSVGQSVASPSRTDHSTIRINFADLFSEEPDLVADIFKQVKKFIRRFAQHLRMTLKPHVYSIKYLSHALGAVKENADLGATLVVADERSVVRVAAKPAVKHLSACIDGGTYVLAGGLGGLGRAIAQHMVANGARNLLFLSRSSNLSTEASEFMQSLTARGVVARHCAVDICDAPALRQTINSMTPKMPPVSGVIQGAAVLRDKLFEMMTYDDWRTAVLPKTQGTMNLVNVFDHPDRKPWFLFLSSSSGVIGNRGQANYAAGNTFMDALAGSGLIHGRAVSLDIGPVEEVGMVAEDVETMKKLRETGFLGIRRCDFLRIIERAIGGDVGPDEALPSQVVLGVGTGGLLRQNKPSDPFWAPTALYSHLNLIDMPAPDLAAIEGPSALRPTEMEVPRDSVDKAEEFISEALKVELGLRLATVGAEDIDLDRSIASYGVDSLLAVQIRNWAAKRIGLNLSVFVILGEEPMRELCRSMAEQVCDRGEAGENDRQN
ncbi:phenolpthiocerol synthesis polyketide synthase ppsA [Plectosphaerella plurivora]|uniref:Phenolpthiocerol synthesis polyketide synthase ppsA n=1 Tax=Plectosphaerella plurivora TaxID=936078 RepID=A0A9P8VPN3_9PEZI|nr:phenolpthiocerol synthesis polyketide synthase ppsA [Plectosphaerella plurivora]